MCLQRATAKAASMAEPWRSVRSTMLPARRHEPPVEDASRPHEDDRDVAYGLRVHGRAPNRWRQARLSPPPAPKMRRLAVAAA